MPRRGPQRRSGATCLGCSVKVWVATEGNYSDYRILAVFDTEEGAKSVGDAEEYEVFTVAPEARMLHQASGLSTQAEPAMWSIRIMPWDTMFDQAVSPPVVVDSSRMGRERIVEYSVTARGCDRDEVVAAWKARSDALEASLKHP
jgi:hypothetical protein